MTWLTLSKNSQQEQFRDERAVRAVGEKAGLGAVCCCPKRRSQSMLLSLGGLFLAAACVRDSLGDTCFSHTDGACRSSTMNNTANMLPEGTFRLNDKHELEECEVACAERIDCVAIEWAAITDGHCEIWTVLPTHTEPDCGRLCDLPPDGVISHDSKQANIARLKH